MILRFLRRLFGKGQGQGQNQKPVQSTPKKPVPTTPADPKENINFAFLIGHNQWAQGALNYRGESEWSFNSRIARLASEILAREFGKSCYILFRPGGSYSAQVRDVRRQAREYDIHKLLSLHFDAFHNPSVQGTTGLTVDTPTDRDEKMAKLVTDLIAEEYGISQRGNQGVRVLSSNHSGYGMIRGLSQDGVATVLIEPIFATHDTPATREFFENEKRYAWILAKMASRCIDQDLDS